jgi:hypothetical protein
MTKRKMTKEQTMIYKTLHRKQKIEQQRNPLKPEGELRCSGRVGRSCFTLNTRRVTIDVPSQNINNNTTFT